jgi:hypothetical protein
MAGHSNKVKGRASAYTAIAANLLSAFLRSAVINEDLSVAYVGSEILGLRIAVSRPNTFYGRNSSASCCLRFHYGHWSF